MAIYNKFNQFVQDLAEKVHNLSTDQLEVYLSNALPDPAADLVKTDLAEIATGSGYTGPVDTQNTGAEASGTYTLTGTKVIITATGAMAAFRYVVLFNTTPATDPLIGFWDYGSSLSLQNGETFSIKFNNSDTTGTILTIA
jgi:hypothetical protein